MKNKKYSIKAKTIVTPDKILQNESLTIEGKNIIDINKNRN